VRRVSSRIRKRKWRSVHSIIGATETTSPRGGGAGCGAGEEEDDAAREERDRLSESSRAPTPLILFVVAALAPLRLITANNNESEAVFNIVQAAPRTHLNKSLSRKPLILF